MPDEVRPLVITHNFPTPANPHRGTFVEALVNTWCNLGMPISVMAPIPIWSGHSRQFQFGLPDTPPGANPQILRPPFVSFSAWKVGGLSGHKLSAIAYNWTVRRNAKRVADDPTITYGHFLYPSGLAAASLGERMAVPSVVVIGESGNLLDSYATWMGRDYVAKTLARFSGIISVSEPNREQIIKSFGVDSSRVTVIPNATDTTRFHPRDKIEMRRKLGFPLDRTLIAFLGSFTERKGPRRVLAALEQLPEVGALFIGEGPDSVEGSQVLFADRLTHEAVPEYLCAADLFVLPTQFEGSPNAVIEAMACGVPVVTSDIPAVRATVSKQAALFIDPDDVNAIAGAIRTLVDDPERRAAMGQSALEQARVTSLEERAKRIIAWLSEVQTGYSV